MKVNRCAADGLAGGAVGRDHEQVPPCPGAGSATGRGGDLRGADHVDAGRGDRAAPRPLPRPMTTVSP